MLQRTLLRQLRVIGRVPQQFLGTTSVWSHGNVPSKPIDIPRRWRLYSTSESEDGNTEYLLGVQHFLGKALPVASLEHAIVHWTTAAEKGHVKAQGALGNVYFKGHGALMRNEPLAKQFLSKAAAAGHADSQHTLGLLYYHGSDSTSPNYSLALQYWSQLAKDTSTNTYYSSLAHYYLGQMYLRGLHVDCDEVKAIEYFTIAVQNNSGLSEAHHALGTAHLKGSGGLEPNADKAVQHFRRAANAGYAPAQFDLGACYMLGRGTGGTKNVAKAAEYFFLAAEAGIAQAQLCMGQLYEEGENVPQDLKKAKEYYQSAADQGLHEAKAALARLDLVA